MVIGVPLGIGLAYLLVGLFGRMIFGVSPGLTVDWPVAAASAVAGVAGSVLTASLTLRRPMGTPVREALNSEGLVSAFGASRPDRAIVRSGALPPPLRVGLRNIARQKECSLTTIVQVALAVGTLLGLVSLGQGVSQVTNQSWGVLDYDITLTAQAGGHDYGPGIVDAVRSQPGVAGVEAIDESQMSYRGQTLYALGVDATSFIHEPLTARPLAERPGRAQRRSGHGRRLGLCRDLSTFTLAPRVFASAAAGPAVFTVIGIGGSDANNGFNVYTTFGALQAATGHPGVANTLLIRATDKAHPSIDALAARLEGALGGAGYPSRSQVIYADRASGLAQAQSMLLIVQGIGLLIVAISMLGLVNAVTMDIIERTREIGVLRCLGARARDLRRIFRTETISLAFIGFVLSVPLGWLIAHALNWLVLLLTNGRLPVPYTLPDLGLALMGTLPARGASRGRSPPACHPAPPGRRHPLQLKATSGL